MNRWTTVDPSGFPDGANNRVYAAVPTSQFDPNGNNTQNISANFTLPSATQNDGYIFNVNGTIQASLGQAPSSVGGVAIGGAKQNSFTMYVGVIAQTDISVFYTAESPSIILDTMTLVDGPVVNNVQTKFYSGKAVFTATDAVEFKGTAGVSFSYFGVDFKMGAGGSSTYNYTLSQTNKVSIEVE
jgi:hypothetical protein